MNDREAFEAWGDSHGIPESQRDWSRMAWLACAALASERAKQAEPTPSSDLEKAVASFGAAMLVLGYCPKERRAEMRAWKDEAYRAVIEAALAQQAEPVAWTGQYDENGNAVEQPIAAPPAVQAEPVANLHDNKTAVTEPHPMLSATG